MRITPEMMFPNGINDETDEQMLAAMFAPDGMAKSTGWRCEDGWIVEYTTERLKHSSTRPQDNGKFIVSVFKPYGKGARTDPNQWRRVYWRAFSKRKSARKRAMELYMQHSPEWAEKYGERERAQTA